jgi:hypothetical protein
MLDRGQRLTMWGVRWLLLFALWLGLTDTRVLPELIAGAVAAAIGATVSGLVTRVRQPRTLSKSLALLRLGPRRLGHPLARLFVDTALLTGALWRRMIRRQAVGGAFRAAQYRPERPLESAAGRALMVTWGSLPPNRYVVGLDEEQGVILVHELVREEAPLEPLGRP